MANNPQIQQSAYGAWRVHLEAMRMIISQRGGFGKLVDDHSIQSEASDSLLVHLRQLFSSDALQRKPALGTFLSWPFFNAGMECHYPDSQSMGDGRSFIAESLCRISYMQGDMSWLDAVSFLQCIWKVNLGVRISSTDYVENNKLMCYNRRANGGNSPRCRDVIG